MAILTRLGVVRHAFCVRTFDRRVLINHADGTFYDRDLASAETIDQLYPKIRSVYNSDHTIIAKRKHPQAALYKLS
ncbi:hypothetical protein A3778_15625 (plasmid) [Lacticaseibacillus paracasei]|uniref:hypothetical protein n=1 Tax=Lacticaseibacillus paracasei TaxID=1597 RepID=UPI0009C27160|nr:hypothetical protein [Lacticaseibacillus paracasei]ARE45526.1 hypothetical protein A3778_15625 [Lacticaseibacillus paracasei]